MALGSWRGTGSHASTSIRRYLATIVLAALLPTGVFAAVLLYAIWSDQRRSSSDELIARTRAVASLVQSAFDGTLARLGVLATDPAIGLSLRPRFHERLVQLVDESPDWANLASQSVASPVIEAARPWAGASDEAIVKEAHRLVIEGRQPVVLDHTKVPGDGPPAIVIAYPVMQDEVVTVVLSAVLNLDTLNRKLAGAVVADAGVVALVDQRHRFIARSRDPALYVGRPISTRLSEAMRRANHGTIRGETREGERTFTAFSRLPDGFFIGVATPSAPLDRALARSLLILAGILAAMLALSLLMSRWLVDRIDRHVAQTVAFAARLAAGEEALPPTSRVRELAVISESVRTLFLNEREARDKERAASNAKDDFLAMLGHELRNPLAPITTAVHLMRSRGDSTFAQERGIIERQVRHMQRLVDDLLDIARVVRGAISLHRQPLEIASVVDDALETAQPLLAARRIRADVEVPRQGLVVDGDPARLCQVVANLLTNAARFNEPGGTVAIRAARDGDRVVLQVSDQGVGITADDLRRVFEPFTQARQTVDRPDGGLGLGLAIARRIARLHQGDLTAQSAGPGAGSTLTLFLPLARERVRPDAPPAAGQDRPDGPDAPMVMIVDDNVDAAESLAELIGLWGYRHEVVMDGREVLPLLPRIEPDIVLMDIGLPGLDGYEVATEIRRDPRWASIRLIALTGYGQASDIQKSLEAGFEHHLVKPVDLARLAAILAGDSARPPAAPAAA